jgi:hypothetical protein
MVAVLVVAPLNQLRRDGIKKKLSELIWRLWNRIKNL